MHFILHEWCLHYDRCSFNLHVKCLGSMQNLSFVLSFYYFTRFSSPFYFSVFLSFLILKYIPYYNHFGQSSELCKLSEMHKLS